MTSAPAIRRARRRSGFTLIEMMMAVLLTMMVFAATIPFFRQQTMAVDRSAGRLDALQNARYAQNAIDRELRMAGGVTGQPIIVQAAPFAITFNVNLVSNTANDPNSTYYNPYADSLAVESWEPARSKKLPTSAVVYPTQFYYDANNNQSPAETISYFLYPDSSTGRHDLYTLYRRVNDRDSTLISNDLWIPTDTAYFFHYYKANTAGTLTMIAAASLPLYWTDATKQIDSIASVYMRVAGLYRDVRKATDVTRTIYHTTTLLNYGMLEELPCGGSPAVPGAVSLTQVMDTTVDSLGVTHIDVAKINVAWAKSADDGSGQSNVGLYVVERQLQGATDWQVLANVPSNGTSIYSYNDFAFASGTWTYGVVAQNCSPANSAVTIAGSTVTNP